MTCVVGQRSEREPWLAGLGYYLPAPEVSVTDLRDLPAVLAGLD